MEDILKEIIEADKVARNKVEAKKSEKFHLDELLKALQETRSQEALDELNQHLAVNKRQLDEEYESVRKQMQEQFENDKQTLLAKYNANKEAWLQAMFLKITKVEEHE